MYGLPKDAHFDFLKDRTLIQIAFGRHDLVLYFEPNISISVTSKIGFYSSDNILKFRGEDFREAAKWLVYLANHDVLEAKGEPEGTLTIIFKEGERLEIYDNSEQYESYVVSQNKNVLFVV